MPEHDHSQDLRGQHAGGAVANRAATSTGEEDGPPSAWQRHDVLVVIGALALLAAGRLAHDSLARPPMIELVHQDLRLERPGGWLPAVTVDESPPPLAAGLAEVREATVDGAGAADSEDATASHHVVYTSPADTATRVEVHIATRPRYGNLAGAIGFLRRIRYGELYRSFGTEVVTIGERAWLRTRFRYAYKLDKRASPRLATGIELATARGDRIYSVTVHGEEARARHLAELIAPTLALDGPGGGLSRHDAPAVPGDDATAAAMGATVMIVAVDLVGGRLEPVSGGSGVIVSPGGAVLTNAHVVVGEDRERFHDLFAIGRYRGPEREPEFVCAGYPEQGAIDLARDLALLRCTMDMSARPWAPRNWPKIPMGRSDTLVPGEPIRVLGYPDTGGGGLRVAAGEITGWTGADGQSGRDYVKTDADISPGSSGGAVINERGALIGVATAYRVRAQVRQVGPAPGPGPPGAPEPAPAPGRGERAGDPADGRSAPRLEVERIGLIRPIDQAAHLLARTRSEGTEGSPRRQAARSEADPDTGRQGHEPPNGAPRGQAPGGVMITSKVVDAANDRPIAGAMVIVFAPGLDARELDRLQLEEQALAWGQTDEDGEFWLRQPLARGEQYTVAVRAEGYHPLTGDGALLLAEDTPDFFDPWGVIRLARK